MLYDAHGRTANRGERSTCPSCAGELLAKCGPIVIWHWAHRAADCDPWAEPESHWHLAWKRYLSTERGARCEVPIGRHRADAVLPNGRIVELQSAYLPAEEIAEREAFYGPELVWIYNCTWDERLHFGRRGFWWKHGSKAMATHRRPVWWDMGDELWQVRLGLAKTHRDLYAETPTIGLRVLGRVLRKRAHDDDLLDELLDRHDVRDTA